MSVADWWLSRRAVDRTQGCWDPSPDSRYAVRFRRRSRGPSASPRTSCWSGRSSRRSFEFFDANHQFAELAAAAGFAGLDSADGFAAALFSLLAIPTGLYAATRLAGLVADERARRWTPYSLHRHPEFGWPATRSR